MFTELLARRSMLSVPAPISVIPTLEFEGNDGPWSTFPIQVGSPPQMVHVLLSTASSQTWTISPQGCFSSSLANCSTLRGGFFQPNSSSSWIRNQDASGGLYPLNLEVDLNTTGTGLYGYDTVALGIGDRPEPLDHQIVASIASEAYYLGLFGLNPRSSQLPGTTVEIPSFIGQLNESNLIPSLSWSYTAGNQYRPGPAYGNLILGGYDTSRYEANNVTFKFNDTDLRAFMVNIGSIVLATNDTVTDLNTDGESIPAFIDSTTPYIILPLNVCEQFEETFGITWDDDVQAYLVNDTLHSALVAGNASVVFNLGNSSMVPGQGFNVSLPYSAFNLTASAPLLTNQSRYFPLMRASNESEITLGRTFLQEAYLIADYERGNFSVSQCSWTGDLHGEVVAIRRTGDVPESRGLSPGAKAGISIGVIAGVLILAAIAFIFWRRWHPKKPTESVSPLQINDAPVEIDNAEKDPYTRHASDYDKHHPYSPELDSTVHKGHEIDGRAQSTQLSLADDQRYELDATERQSRTLSSPISLVSDSSDPRHLHQRQISDPLISPALPRETSDPGRLHRRDPSDPISATSPTSVTRTVSSADNTHKRELSDPVSLMSEKKEEEVVGTP